MSDAFFYLFGDEPRLDDMIGDISIDCETTGLKWTDDLIGIALAWRSPDGLIKSCYLSKMPGLFSDDIYTIDRLYDVLVNLFTYRRVFGHYFSFDVRVLFREFDIVPKRCLDTWHMAKSTGWRKSNSLAGLVPEAGIKDPVWQKQKSERANLKNTAPHATAVYARKDAEYTLLVFEYLLPLYEAQGFAEVDEDFNRLTYRMMARGFPINESLLEQRIKEQRTEFRRRQLILADHGIPNVMSRAKVLNRLKSLGIAVEGVGAKELEPYAHLEIVDHVVIAGQLASNLGSRLEVYQSYQHNGRLHSEWHPFGTASYRMVAKDPNLMAQPLKDREGRAYPPLAEIFVTEEEYVLQLDIAQAEFRLAAMIAGANSMAKYLDGGSDPYMEMARQAYQQANSETRQNAKRATLASIYEEGPLTFSRKHGVSLDEATRILTDFRSAFPEIKAMSRIYQSYAEKHRFINLWTGRQIFFAPDDDRLYRAFNQEVQGGIAELMRHFMLDFDKLYPDLLIGQVHDSVLTAIRRQDVSLGLLQDIQTDALRILRQTLPDKVYDLTTPAIALKLDAEALVPCLIEGGSL